MADFFDLLNLTKVNPDAAKAIIKDKEKMAEFKLTSAELEVLQKLEPDQIKLVINAIEDRLRVGPVAGTNACPGTFACFESKFETALRR